MTAELWSLTLTDVLTALGSVPLFSVLTQEQLRRVAETGTGYRYKPGHTIVGEGTTGVGFYMILDGKVNVRKGSKVLATLAKGEFFGEMSLIDGQPRSADVVAVESTRCFTVSTGAFSNLIRSNPDMAWGILNGLVKRIRTSQATS